MTLIQLRLKSLHFTQYHHLSLHQATTFHCSLNHKWTFHYFQSAKTLFKSHLIPILWTCLSRKNVQIVCGVRSLRPSCQLLDWKEILRVQIQIVSLRTSQLRFLNTLRIFQLNQNNKCYEICFVVHLALLLP